MNRHGASSDSGPGPRALGAAAVVAAALLACIGGTPEAKNADEVLPEQIRASEAPICAGLIGGRSEEGARYVNGLPTTLPSGLRAEMALHTCNPLANAPALVGAAGLDMPCVCGPRVLVEEAITRGALDGKLSFAVFTYEAGAPGQTLMYYTVEGSAPQQGCQQVELVLRRYSPDLEFAEHRTACEGSAVPGYAPKPKPGATALCDPKARPDEFRACVMKLLAEKQEYQEAAKACDAVAEDPINIPLGTIGFCLELQPAVQVLRGAIEKAAAFMKAGCTPRRGKELSAEQRVAKVTAVLVLAAAALGTPEAEGEPDPKLLRAVASLSEACGVPEADVKARLDASLKQAPSEAPTPEPAAPGGEGEAGGH